MKKRILSLLLCVTLCLSLAACARGEEKPSSSADTTASSQPTDATEPSQGPTDTPASSQEPTDAPEPSLAPGGTADAVDYVRIITDARGEGETTPIMTADTQDDPTEKEMTFAMLGFTPEDAEAYGVSLSLMNVRAYAIVAVKPAQGKAETVKKGLEDYVEAQKANFERYLEDQYQIASKAKLETLDDGTILLVMCEGQDAIFNSIKTALSK